MIDVKTIWEYLPHRYPFLLVDRVLEIELGQSILALKNVSINEPFFQGHFPDVPVMPGVLIIEAMAQAAGILGFMTMQKTPTQGSIYYLVGVDNARFKRPVVPGDQLHLKVAVMSEKKGIWKFFGSAHVNQQLASSAEIMCAERKVLS